MFLVIFVVSCLTISCASQAAGSLPSPPVDVHFTVSSDGHGHGGVITAIWRPPNCRGHPNCTEPLGYVITCSLPESEISTTVWKSQIMGMDPISVNITGADPAAQYVCRVASFNSFGVGNSGSNIFVDTPEAVPRTAPTQVYSSDIQTESIRLNWHYYETPSPGAVTTFKIELYYKDNRYPARDGEHVRNNVAQVDRSSVVFSYLLMYLDPGTEYNVLIRAVTAAGEGPAVRIRQQTLCTVPSIIPDALSGSILSYVHSEPPSFFFQWTVRNQDQHLLHNIAGFVIKCSANKTNGFVTISEPVFIASHTSMESVFSGLLYYPNTCGSSVSEEVLCSVAAFNSRGVGGLSDTVIIQLPCSSDSPGTLKSSFLTNPYVSLCLLLTFILLLLGVTATIILHCVCSSVGSCQQKAPSSSSLDDNNYVPMASSDVEAIRSRLSDPQAPGVYSGPVGVVMIGNGDPPYDEIPAEMSDNLYDEIHPRIYQPDSAQEEPEPTGDIETGNMITPLRSGLQTIPLLSSSQSGMVRGSTITEYMELSSPLMEGDDSAMRYSTADSGVNLTSSDLERGLNLNHTSLHSKLPQNEAVENVRFRFQTDKLSDQDKSHSDSTQDSHYVNTLLPYSMSDKNGMSLEQTVDTKVAGEEVEAESGVGMESQVSNTNSTCLYSRPNMEPDPTTVVISVSPKYINVAKSTRIGKNDSEGESEGEGGGEGGDGDSEREDEKDD